MTKPYRDKFEIIKTVTAKNGIKYRIRKDGPQYCIEYLSPMLSGSTRKDWKYVGLFQMKEWAEKHLEEIQSLMGGKP